MKANRENYTMNRDSMSIGFTFSNETLMQGKGYIYLMESVRVIFH